MVGVTRLKAMVVGATVVVGTTVEIAVEVAAAPDFDCWAFQPG